MQTIEELKQDHEDEKRMLVADWARHRDDCVWGMAWKAGLYGFVLGVLLMGMFKLFSSPGANPNPKNFQVIKEEKIGAYTLLLVKYPECKNYEGTKILVWQGPIGDYLDPHFNELDQRLLARFRPNTWDLAKKFLEGLR